MLKVKRAGRLKACFPRKTRGLEKSPTADHLRAGERMERMVNFNPTSEKDMKDRGVR